MQNNYDIREVFDHYNIEYKESGNGYIDVLCPFHEDNNFGNAKWNDEKGIFKCFSCGKGGNIFNFVAMMEGPWCNLDYAEKLIASNFTYTGGYNVDVLKAVLANQFKTRRRRSNVLVVKCVERMIETFGEKNKPPFDLFSKWVPIITYLNFYTVYELNKQEISRIIDLYTQFFKELNTEKQ